MPTVDSEQRRRANLSAARALLQGLVDGGVRHAVISPGSRSTPLVMAIGEHAALKTWVIPDERSAAFFALGLVRGGATAMVIATSGTAPANWYPAVIEAAQDHQSLILISADRPAELHDCGANQTIDQSHLFGSFARAYFGIPEPDSPALSMRYFSSIASRAAARSQWPLPGPVHINVPFREPLTSDASAALQAASGPESTQVKFPALNPCVQDIEQFAQTVSGKRGLIVAGRGPFPERFAESCAHIAAQLACPILADPLSGLRYGGHDRSRIVCRYDAFLRRSSFATSHQPDWIIRLGGAPVSKTLHDYLGQAGGQQLLVVPTATWPDPVLSARTVIHCDPLLFCDALGEHVEQTHERDWLNDFLTEEQRSEQLARGMHMPLEAQVLGSVARNATEAAVVFAGNSMIIRDVDSFMCGGDHPLTLMGNRGVSGIDGNISTVFGLAAAAPRPVLGLLGDLAVYHDLQGLICASQVAATLIVFNNGGGAIFEYLPQAELPDFERYWLTPTSLDLEQVARVYGLMFHRVADAEQFEKALLNASATGVTNLIEVFIDRRHSVQRHQAYWHAVAGA